MQFKLETMAKIRVPFIPYLRIMEAKI